MNGTHFDDFDMGNTDSPNFSSITGQAQFEWEWRNEALDLHFCGVVVGETMIPPETLVLAFGKEAMDRYLSLTERDIIETMGDV